MTHIQNRRQAMAASKAAVCHLFGWSEGHYAEYQYAKGLRYIELYFKSRNGEDLLSRVEQSRTFWNWWKNCWLNREEVYLNDVFKTQLSRQLLKDIYIALHSPEILAEELMPGRPVWNEILPTLKQQKTC